MRNHPKKMLACMLAFCLALPIVMSGCSTNASTSEGNAQEATEVSAGLKEKYGNSVGANYKEGIREIPRDHEFTISYDFDPVEIGMDNYNQIASLYYDAELTQPVLSSYDWASDDKKSYTISPGEYPGRSVYVSDNDEEYAYGFKKGATRLFEKEKNADWGNVGTMYLATMVDLATGKKLDKPQVQVVTVKGELDTPSVTLELSDDGLVKFTWNEVKGAKAYYIVEFSLNEKRAISSGRLIGQTKDTTWMSEKGESSTGVYSTNQNFKIYTVSEDEWLSQPIAEEFGKTHDPANGAVIDTEGKGSRAYCVIAVNDEGSSMYSRMFDVQEIASLSPATLAYNMEKLSEEGFSGYVKGVPMMPSYRWIVMCDGALSQRLVNYDFDAATTEKQTWYNEKEDTGGYEAVSVDALKVPYTVEGTAFSGELVVTEYSNDWKKELASVEKRQESLRNKTGDVKREITTEKEESDTPDKSTEGKVAVDEKQTITANSALSEYLALNMINGNKVVSLKDYPEAIDQELLADAWAEAFYQNPLVLGVSGAMTSRDGKTLYLEYEDDQDTRKKKQDEIVAKVDAVVSEIITDSMTPREKEYAINQYLCDTVEYDVAALENAEKYDFTKTDKEFFDSFTAYGTLINGVGVCASYSASFKLLADEAGLDCLVVTGYLDGSLGHAWNRVKLGEGQWATVDATNNDTDIIANALLNVPDSAVASTLVEDDAWVINSVLGQYNNESDQNEFYHVEELFFDETEVVNELINQLSSGDTAVVRTNYALNDAQFYQIGGQVLDATGNVELGGFYWMGIVVLTNNPSLLEG